MFAIAYHLHCSVTVVEAMSHREVLGWFEALGMGQQSQPERDPDAMEYSALSKADLKAAFR